MDDGSNETLGREALEQRQLERLRSQLTIMLEDNPFYRDKLHAAGIRAATDIEDLADLDRLPRTTKDELSEDQRAHPPYGSNCSLPHAAYSRLHQTSGTTGERLRWLDTAHSWDWWGRCWQAVYRAAGVGAAVDSLAADHVGGAVDAEIIVASITRHDVGAFVADQ